MTQTYFIGDNGPWKYIGLLNECIKIVLTIGLGSLAGFVDIVQAPTFVPITTKFVFYVALPCLVVQGLGISVDFYDASVLWSYIGAFLLLRAIALLGAVVWVLLTFHDNSRLASSNNKTSSNTAVGQVVVYWLASTWISTVILGVPIAGAIFQDPNLGLQYGVLAGVSSFIFQLPLQLFLLECHGIIVAECPVSSKSEPELQSGEAEEQEDVADSSQGQRHTVSETFVGDIEDPKSSSVETKIDEIQFDDNKEEHTAPKSTPSIAESDTVPATVPTTTNTLDHVTLFTLFRRGGLWKKIVWQLVSNPVLWAILVGFVLTLSTVGPRFLRPSSEDYVPAFGWIWLTLSWFGACVSPLALFSMGVWMQHRHRQQCRLRWDNARRSLWYMVIKLVLVPLLTVGLAKAVRLDNQSGRAAVLIAALPISLASFTLASRYKVGEDALSANVTLGTVLVLPTILIWNAVLDVVGVFPIDQ